MGKDNDLHLRLGTRGSTLARMQSQWVARTLEQLHPQVKVELIICKTTGDRITDRPLHEAGGKGLFTKELEEALLEQRIDFAVHSLKDVPVTMPLVDTSDLVLAAIPEREDPSDVLVAATAKRLVDLPPGSRVGTGSLRRKAQILALRPDLRVEHIRGNIDTRLRKQNDGEYDALILAVAGLKRAGLFDSQNMSPVPFDEMLPAAGQGALALQCRASDASTRRILQSMHHEHTGLCVDLERAIVKNLDGDCQSPIGALATIDDDRVMLRATVAAYGGVGPVVVASADAPFAQSEQALHRVLDLLTARGARELLHPDAG